MIKKVKMNKQLDIIKLQQLILNALSEEYPQDNVSPGLVCAYVPRPFNAEKVGLYYVSLCRYNYNNEKEVLFKASKDTLADALITVCKEWLKLHSPKTSKEDLIKYIREVS